ncbi:MAG: hypothetical protein K0S00_2878 [Xanthobacteraceae bacterium]|jgi:hypothetical protein|nr:hypothetical protein [Xanthobacteraceae bacterium]
MTTPEQIEQRRAKHRKYMAEYRARNPEKQKQWLKTYRTKNRNTINEKHREYIICHADEVRISKRNYRKTHRAEINKYNLSWKLTTNGIASTRLSRLRYQSKRKIRSLSGRQLHAMIEKFVPHNLPLDLRHEIVSETAISLLTGECLIKNIQAKTKQALQAHHRMFSKFGPVSLDAARFDDGASTLHDTVSVGLWD